MAKLTVFQTVYPHAAGIDVGAANIYVSIDGEQVECFDTFTQDYHRCAAYLKESGIRHAAMEATGVYWMALYAILEDSGVRICLVNPKETRQVKGRKTDVQDCRWIQKLFAAGILRASFIPEGRYMELRQLVRERLDVIEMGSTYVNKMQKCLELMNIKLPEVLCQVHGTSGMRIIQALLDGERDGQRLLGLCDKRIIKNKGDLVLKALQGDYRETYLFMLGANMQMWQQHQSHLATIDQEIEKLLDQLCLRAAPLGTEVGQEKPARHHAPQVADLHQKLVQLYGVNISTIPGLNDYTLLRLAGETGTDMGRFPTVKHFVKWCGLAPGQNQSGKKTKRLKATSPNKAGQIFRESAQSLLASKYVAIGSFMRRLKARKDTAVVVKAGARKIAEAYYLALTKGVQYVEQGTKKYEEQIRQKEKTTLYRLAKKLNLQVVEKHHAA